MVKVENVRFIVHLKQSMRRRLEGEVSHLRCGKLTKFDNEIRVTRVPRNNRNIFEKSDIAILNLSVVLVGRSATFCDTGLPL